MKRLLCAVAFVLFSFCGMAQAEDFNMDFAEMAYGAYSTSANYWTDCIYQRWAAEDAEEAARDLDEYWVSLGNDSILDEILDPSHDFYQYYAIAQFRQVTAAAYFATGIEWHNEGQEALLNGDNRYYEHAGHGGYDYVVGTGGSYSWVWNPYKYCPEGEDCASYSNGQWVTAMMKCGGMDWPVWQGYGPPDGQLNYGACGQFYNAFKDYEDIAEFWGIICEYIYEEMNGA